MRKPFQFIFLFIAIIAFYLLLPSGCANIIPPSGGPRDSLPPRLVSVFPKDSTVNFRGSRITFTFDEYIGDPQDLQTNLLFTPLFDRPAEIAIRAKTMTVRFRDSLLPNTTYTLNFGNAIRDVNESNVLKNFVYTFSTGSYLDSITLSGKVVLAQTGRYDSTLIVILHRNLSDTAVRTQSPVYAAKVDAAGNFKLVNLPKGTFALYALGDAGSIRRYQDTSKLFAFFDEPVIAGATRNVTLLAYRYAAAPSTTPPVQNSRGTPTADRRLRFNPPAGAQDLKNDFVLTFLSPLRRLDSTQISLSTDTTYTPAAYKLNIDSTKKELHFAVRWKEGTRYNLILTKEFAEDTLGKKLLKGDTLTFTTKKRSDYGALKIRIRNLDAAKNPVLQFVQNDAVLFSASIKSGTYVSDLFAPGDYELRILYDTNNNGKWDPGHFPALKRQPEIVKPVERKLSVKASLDNELDISL